jgi:hypothetical protein
VMRALDMGMQSVLPAAAAAAGTLALPAKLGKAVPRTSRLTASAPSARLKVPAAVFPLIAVQAMFASRARTAPERPSFVLVEEVDRSTKAREAEPAGSAVMVISPGIGRHR